MKDAFRNVPVAPQYQWLLDFTWWKKFYKETCLSFGLATVTFIFNLFAEALHWLIAVGSTAILCLHRECISARPLVSSACVSDLFFVSCIPRLVYSASHVFHVSCIPCLMYSCLIYSCLMYSCLMYSVSHVFRVSSCLIPYLFHVSAHRVSTLRRLRPCLNLQIVSQIMSRLQATSRNRLCLTRIEIGDSWRNRMYIERADILYSDELRDQLHNSTYSLMRFLL